MQDQDYILCECELQPLEDFVVSLEETVEVKLVKEPAICMTMVQAEDSVEFQPFYLGEALTTECELLVNGTRGIGICLGDEPVRAYCIAFMDAYTQLKDVDMQPVIDFLSKQSDIIEHNAKVENDLIQRTKVDFKLMEQD
ncbi:phosphonate C-P lyase system protein PhnG [Mucilaginibacter jinjuensis]|uniref:Phosphonate C-P lyase system protein PhnG n=1 Tax=Mucilaginibacter jinjuensis TaxID=1176721 RepID=A0ABY7TG92_9SPHI|nr:phosphonate C-P lyase system protein PhnG [Mucilaginibacter jinjuensis]WCT14607.1 phosphonate C-P lyase system protein PhnG [Mucilaginibacter jinjuensis]